MNNRTTIFNYKGTNGAAKGIGLVATAENQVEFKQRRISKFTTQNWTTRKEVL